MTNPSDTRDSELVAARGYYIASKVRHAERWRDLRSFERDPIISTWIDDGDDVDHADLWERCIAEASRAAALIFYAEPDETFKGAWVEIGAALANNVPVFAVGMDREHRDQAVLEEARASSAHVDGDDATRVLCQLGAVAHREYADAIEAATREALKAAQ